MQTEWIIVLNGNCVKFLTLIKQHLDHALPSVHKDQVVDNFDKDAKKPGHIRQAQGFLGNVVSPRDDLHSHEKKEFIKLISETIIEHQKNFDTLVLIGPSKDVETLKSFLNEQIIKKIKKEIHKDLTKHSLEDVKKHLFL